MRSGLLTLKLVECETFSVNESENYFNTDTLQQKVVAQENW